MPIFENLDDKIKCPKCGYVGTSAIGGQASCPLGHGLFPYSGQSEPDVVLKQTTDAIARMADEVRRVR